MGLQEREAGLVLGRGEEWFQDEGYDKKLELKLPKSHESQVTHEEQGLGPAGGQCRGRVHA